MVDCRTIPSVNLAKFNPNYQNRNGASRAREDARSSDSDESIELIQYLETLTSFQQQP